MTRFSLSLVLVVLIVLSLFITTATACTRCTKKKRCPKGAYCRTGKCIYYVRPGARCNPKKCVVCAKGAVCRKGRCVAKSSTGAESQSQPTNTKSGMQCSAKCMADRDCKAKGYLCYGGSCVTFVGEKKSCGGCVRCQRGMSCDKSGLCRKIERFVKQCEGCSNDKDCQKGLYCKTLPNGNRRCAKPNGIGGQCDGPCFGCQSRYVCIRGKCVVPPKKQGRCGECDHSLGCLTGLKCQMYAPGKGRCVTQLALGEDCTDVCDDCGEYMTCRRDGKCGPHGKDKCEVCEQDVDCADGFVCKKGASGYGRCAAMMPKGKECADPCSACEEGLVCRNGQVCDMPKGKKCDRCRKDVDCTNGLVCKLGDSEWGRCATPMILGAKCSDPCWACHPGLVCSKDQVCVEPKADWCEQCAVDGDCVAGLVCKTDGHGKGKCARPMSAGQKCSDPCWGCKQGLQCRSVDGYEICVKLKEDVCGSCARDGDCRQGLICKKDASGKGKCAKVMPIGASCKDPCWACDRGLVCVGGKRCATPKEKLCGPCYQTSDCDDGLTCKMDVSGLGRCAKPMDVGSTCDHSCWTCKAGSTCGNDYVCREMPQHFYSQRPSIRPRAWSRMSKSPVPSKSPAYSRYSWPGWYYRLPSSSPTPSMSNTPSSSPTPSLSNSPSRSPKPSTSNTPSGSPTPSVSSIPSTSSTPSSSITPSTSSTASRSPTPSISRSPSRSPTPSMSNSPSASSTPSTSNTPSKSPSMSSTPSTSPTPSVSVTPSRSATPSVSNTPSRSPTPSQSPIPSKSPTPSASATPSESASPSNSPRPSSSPTPSPSQTPSESPSPSKSSQPSRSPSPSASPSHGRYCSPCNDSSSCMSGLVCHEGKCSQVRDLGYDCRDPCHKCKSGLVCDKKKGICVSDRCGSCQWSVDCRDGLTCHMHGHGVGKCMAWADDGEDCSDGCSKCKKGLSCRDGRCERPKSEKCGPCSEDVDCEGELTCNREGGSVTEKCDKMRHGKCVSVTGVGGVCQDGCTTCEKGLVCKDKDGKCGEIGKKCDECDRDEECEEGLKCKIIGGRGKCARVMGEGQKCNDPCWACGEGLACGEGRICRRL